MNRFKVLVDGDKVFELILPENMNRQLVYKYEDEGNSRDIKILHESKNGWKLCFVHNKNRISTKIPFPLRDVSFESQIVAV